MTKDVLTITEVVHGATKAAAEAHREVFKQCHNAAAADESARLAFTMNMPTLETRVSVQAYLACVARGIELHLIRHREAVRMVATARAWLAADAASRRAATHWSLANDDRPGSAVQQ